MAHSRKRTLLASIVSLVLILCVSVFGGCSLFGDGGSSSSSSSSNSKPEPQAPTEFTVSYEDDTGMKRITVSAGEFFSLEEIPSRVGYDFKGLFNAETGGTQYVTKTGESISPFTDKRNILLFPQFSPREYTIVLDYQGAAETGAGSIPVNYDAEIADLPGHLELEHKNFTGWFTEENCGGTKVADAEGKLRLKNGKNTLNEFNFDLSAAENRVIRLYAGFETEKFSVTFNYCDDSLPSDRELVEYGTRLSDIVPKTRKTEGSEKGFAVLSWSKDRDSGAIFNGEITDAVVLYAMEWAPVIDFDTDGGNEVPSLVAKGGSAITLPVPEKQCAKFLNWETGSGEVFETSTMPEQSVSVKARWQGKLVFDENGGTDVDDVSQPAGTEIILPVSEKQGYAFAGWYTEDKEKFTAGSMPLNGVLLKAGWYEVKTEKVIQRAADKKAYDVYSTRGNYGPWASDRFTIDLSDKIPQDGGDISFVIHTKICGEYDTDILDEAGFCYYDDAEISEATYLGKTVDRVTGSAWSACTFSIDLHMRSNKLYICYYGRQSKGSGDDLYFDDIWYELTYPDVSTLCL